MQPTALPKVCAGVLLTHGDNLGTLAAARAFDRLKVPSYLAEHQRFSLTQFSRCVRRTIKFPALSDWEGFARGLLKLAEEIPQLLLYPTSDDSAWLIAQNQKELATKFHLYSPPVDVIYQLLNKQRLFTNCQQWGIPAPQTLFPRTTDDMHQHTFKDGEWLLKPRTQIGLRHGYKGFIVQNAKQMLHDFDYFRKRLVYQEQLLAFDPDVVFPILQRYFPHAQESIISVSGFYHPTRGMLALGSRKIFQFPKRLGIGLCFEGLQVPVDCREYLETLFKRCGYYGVFEAEFIWNEEAKQHLLIDVNPRFYGQMGFDIQRGLPLPGLALAAAIDDQEFLDRLWAQGKDLQKPEQWNYGNGWMLVWMLAFGYLGGRTNRTQISQWKAWFKHPERPYADAIYDQRDRAPYFVAILSQIFRSLRHPRDSFRKYVLQSDL